MAEGHNPTSAYNLGAPITANTQSPGTGLNGNEQPYQMSTDNLHNMPAPGATAVNSPAVSATDPQTRQPISARENSRESHGDGSSSGGTLAEDGPSRKELAAPEGQIGTKRSAHSSLDHVAELGTENRVSVRRGKEEFAALERKFSNMSQRSQELQRSTTRGSSIRGFVKPSKVLTNVSAMSEAEKAQRGQEDEKEEFDLAGVLHQGRDASDQAGIKHKKVGVAWDDLEVIGAGGMRINIRTFPNAIMEQFMMPVIKLLGVFGLKLFAPSPKTILYKNSGMLKPGEMCLVLGRPGSGCSTFLKSIANQRDSFMEVNGDVEYAGVDWTAMRKYYAG